MKKKAGIGLLLAMVMVCGSAIADITFDWNAINQYSDTGSSGSRDFMDTSGRYRVTVDHRDMSGQLGTGLDRVTVVDTQTGSVLFDGNVADGGAGDYLVSNIDAIVSSGMNTGNASVGPASSIGSTIHIIMRTHVLPRAEPALSRERKRSGSMRVDMFYNNWEIDTAGSKFEGKTFGLNPSIMFGGEEIDFALAVPLHVIRPDDGDDVYNAGVDGLMRFRLGEYFAFGAHALLLYEFGEDSDYDKHYYLSGGPFASLMLPLNDVFSLSLACMFEYTKPEEEKYGDDVKMLIPAANVGINLTDEMALNVYGMYYKNLDSDVEDDHYIDVGGELAMALGSVWSLSLGGKKTFEWDDYDSWEVFLGSEWTF